MRKKYSSLDYPLTLENSYDCFSIISSIRPTPCSTNAMICHQEFKIFLVLWLSFNCWIWCIGTTCLTKFSLVSTEHLWARLSRLGSIDTLGFSSMCGASRPWSHNIRKNSSNHMWNMLSLRNCSHTHIMLIVWSSPMHLNLHLASITCTFSALIPDLKERKNDFSSLGLASLFWDWDDNKINNEFFCLLVSLHSVFFSNQMLKRWIFGWHSKVLPVWK